MESVTIGMSPAPSESPPDALTLPPGMVTPMPPNVNLKSPPPDVDIEPISRSNTAPEDRMPYPKNTLNDSVERYDSVCSVNPLFHIKKRKNKIRRLQ